MVTTALDLEELGEQAVAIARGDVPPEYDAWVRVLAVDTLGALVGGLRYPPVRALGQALATAGDDEFASMVTLGSAATWLDADSGGSFHPHGDRLPPVPTAHPAPHALPVILRRAAGDADDAALLHALAAGSELGMRLGAGSTLRLGLHPHGIHGQAAAAVTWAVLEGADASAVGRAFARGAALPLAATLAVPTGGGTARNLWTGLGCYYGVLAGSSEYDTAGVRGIDVRRLTALYDGAVCTELDTEVLLGMRDRWRLRSSYLKPYACARWIHPALDALTHALDGRTADRVDAVEVDTFAFAASLGGTAPETDMAARFSLPFSLATLAVDGHLDAAGFLPERLARSSVRSLAARITTREDPAFSAALPAERPASVRVRWSDGTTSQGHVRNARGNPDVPLSTAEVERKFRANVGDLLSAETVDEVAGWLNVRPPVGSHMWRRVAAELEELLGW